MSILLRTVRALMLAVPFCLAGPAQAAPISFSFSGTWESVDPLLSSEFSIGQAFSGSFTYEGSAAPLGDALLASYHALTDFRVATDSYMATMSFPGGAPFSVQINNQGFGTEDLLFLFTRDTVGLTGPAVGGLPLQVGTLVFVDFTGSAFATATPLPTNLALSDFDFTELHLIFVGTDVGSGAGSVIGSLTTLTPVPTIPEPTALALYAIGGGIFAMFQRRKRAKLRGLPRVRLGSSK